MFTTITDIANQAGTSRATVSRVLRGDKTFMVAKTTRERVLEVASRLNYRPNRAAKLLSKGKTGTIGVAIAHYALTSWVWRGTMPLTLEIIQGIQEELLDHGYDLKLILPAPEKTDECIRKNILDEQRVDGVILFGDPGFAKYIPEMVAHQIKCVTFAEFSKDYGIPVVTTDLRPGIEQMVQAAWTLGHRAVGCITMSDAGTNPRLEIFAAACRRLGMTLRDEHCKCIPDEGHVWRATEAIMKTSDRPSLLFYTADHLAVWGLGALRDAGLDVPRDLSVIGIDDAPYLPSDIVPLATIRQPRRERGRLAASTLLQLINGAALTPDTLTLKCQFVPRQSLGPALQDRGTR